MHRRLRLHFFILLCLGSRAWAVAEASPMRFRAMPSPAFQLTSMPTSDRGQGLPPGWGFHPISPTGLYPTENGDVAISMDPSSGRILESYREGDVEVREPLVFTPEEYNQILSGRTVRRLWNDKTRQTRSVARGQGRGGGLFRVELPVQFPKVIRSIVGDGAPNIEVSGSESITLSGTSDWIAGQTIQTERQKQSGFPSLEMKQELNVNLTGSIGDKIKVDVDQSSNVQTSLDNKVKLRYEGDEDDMVRSVELGNTNLSVEGASFRQEGLFGVKSVMKMGNVDLTTIASKQQGKTETARFTPSSDNKQAIIWDLDYIRRTYFLISDRPLKYTRGKLLVYRDDGSGPANANNILGIARLDPTISPYDSLAVSPPNPQTRGNFHALEAGTDYQILNPWLTSGDLEIPVIKLTNPLGPTEMLAVAYEDVSTTGVVKPVGTYTPEAYAAEYDRTTLNKPGNWLLLKMIKPRFDVFITDSTGYIGQSTPWYHTLFYELRNFYDLGGRDIALETLILKIRRSMNGNATDPELVDNRSLLQVLGLDQRGRAGAADPTKPDGLVDDNYIDRVSGVLFFPDLHPFDPDTTNPTGICSGNFGSYNCLDDYGRNNLRTDSSNPANQANPKVYYKNNPDVFADHQFYIDASYKSSQQGYFLGRFDILQNSEQVKVDGIPQTRDRDYHIDYQTGQLTFTNAPKPDQTITVDFSFSPGLGTSQLTLLGASASYVPGPNLSVTSSILYDSRGAQEKNPKLGEEPARSIIGDLSSVVTFRPVWMTALANAIPGVRTSTPSQLNIQGHAAVSVPNPNTAGEAYIDDMEGNRESNTAALSRTQWFWSSIPFDSLGQQLPSLLADHARIAWFNPPSSLPENHPSKVIERDLKPVLKNEEGGNATHHVLEMNITPPTGETNMVSSNWAGLTQSLGDGGQDFSKLRFLEIWVNDFKPDHTTTNAKLHIDFGRVSEDAFWDPNKPPNTLLDTEDKNQDEKLDRAPVDEDTGLDGKMDPEEPGYDPVTNPDPDGDDYHYDLTNAPDDYSRINNYEKDSSGEQNARPETEDLNHNGFLDTFNDYFEATLDLANSKFVAIDVSKDYAGDPKVIGTIKANNGWRLFRIPLTAVGFRRVNAGSWENIEHMRLWVDGMSAPIKLQIGGVELVGSRWIAQAISDPLAVARGVSLGVGTRNNKDDADVYRSPYDVGNTVGGTATRREQSLALLYAGITPGDSVLAFKTSAPDQSGLGWTQYSQIRFWVHGAAGVETQNLRAVARFGADTLNYYEYSIPVRSGWQDVVIPMGALSGLKEIGRARVKVDSLTAAATGEYYTVVGNPSFTRIYRTSFGVTKHGGSPSAEQGEVWIDDLRLSGVRRDHGMRGDVAIQANFADVVAMNVTHERQDENFFRVGTGANQGSGLNHTATGFSTTFQVDRLMPTAGLQLPVRFSVQHASDVPKFRTGSDVVLSGARSDLETREQNRQTMDLSYRRSGGRKGLSRFTIDALSGALGITRSNSVNPNSRDSSWNFNASTAYELPVGGGGFGLGSKMKINLLPDVVSFTTAWISQRDVSYGRSLQEQTDSLGQQVDSSFLRSDVKTRQLTLGSTSSWTPLSSVRFRYNITSVRNMLLHQDGFFGFNKGTEVDQRRTMEVNYTPRWLALFAPSLNMSGRYHESARPELRLLASDPVGLKSIDNGGTARVTATLPIGRFAQKMTRHPNPKSPCGADPLAPLRAVLTRLQDIQTSFSFERGTAISRVVGDAGFLFETGFTETASPQLTQISNAVFSSNRAYTTGANTSVRPTANLTIDARADHRLTYTDGNQGARRQLSLSLPDLKARWLDLNHLFGLSRSVTSMSMNSAYNLRRDEIGPTAGPLEQRVSTTTWQPLLGWDLAWRNGLRANVSTAVIQATSVDDRSFGVIGDRQTVSTDVRFTKIFPASRGIRFPWSKRPVKLPNDLNLNLTVGMGTDRKVTKRPFFEDLVELDTRRLSVTSGTTYNFTQSISGGFNLGFRNNKDLKTNITTRGITIALNGQFRF